MVEDVVAYIFILISIVVIALLIISSEKTKGSLPLTESDDKLPEKKSVTKIPSDFQFDEKKYEKLKKLKELLDDGVLTQKEFDNEKQRILDHKTNS